MNRRIARTLFHLVLLAHAALWVLWLFAVFGYADSPPQRDWFALREVARSFVAGDWQMVYADRVLSSGPHYFRYPPFVLYLITPLALVGAMPAYALVCAVQLAAAAATLMLLFRIRKPGDVDLNVAAVFGSAAMCHVITSGQNSALLAVVIAGAALMWVRGRDVLAAAWVALLACKPNWLPFFALFAVWRGGIRAGAAFVLTCAALVLSTVPLGTALWRAFFDMTSRAGDISVGYLAYKEITLLAALKSVFGWGALTKTGFALAFAGVIALTVRAVRDGRDLGRAVALVTLLAVVANPYASFYDGFVLAVPGTLWYALSSTYPRRAWRIIGLWIAAYWIWDMAVFYYQAVIPGIGDPRVSAGGFILTGWLVTEALTHTPTTRCSR